MFKIRPSRIYYSQDSINRYFDRRSYHRRTSIGQTLDDICDGRCSLRLIPFITVADINDKWVTSDNRRLWVFRELERLGMCDEIWVREASFINPRKLTSYNGGVTIRVRGDPGGYWYRQERSSRHTRSARNRSSRSESEYRYDDDDYYDNDDAYTRRGHHGGYLDPRGQTCRQISRTNYQPASYERVREYRRYNDDDYWLVDRLQMMRIRDVD